MVNLANFALFFMGLLILAITQGSYSSKSAQRWGKIVGGALIAPPFIRLYLFAIL